MNSVHRSDDCAAAHAVPDGLDDDGGGGHDVASAAHLILGFAVAKVGAVNSLDSLDVPCELILE